MGRERRVLTAIILAGFTARAVLIWLTRPEFVGWFNHSPYYWVQVRGLIRDGRLPFADLPLLFYLYRALAALLRALGWEMEPAIVHASRAVMSALPALMAAVAYGLIKAIRRERPLERRHWTLVALAAFLPLTLVYVPEHLQKNCLGMLLLGALMLASHRALRTRSVPAVGACLALFLLIAVTHAGTLAVTLLYGFALAAAALAAAPRPARTAIRTLALLAAGTGLALTALRLLDPGAFDRAVLYARTSLSASLLGQLLSADPGIRRPMALLAILVPLAVSVLLLRAWWSRRSGLDGADRVFWLGHALFAYALVLPLLDLDLVPRFVLFLPLPALVLLIYGLERVIPGRAGSALVGLAAVGTAAMMFGEVMSLRYHSPHKTEIRRELDSLRESLELGEDDLIIARYGVNTICNWFLGARSALVTSFNRDDMERYNRVFVLVPGEGAQAFPSSPGGEKRLSRIMRADVPLPETLEPRIRLDHMSIYQLRETPESWLFDDDGRWNGVRSAEP